MSKPHRKGAKAQSSAKKTMKMLGETSREPDHFSLKTKTDGLGSPLRPFAYFAPLR
jgi:hypothetical protein